MRGMKAVRALIMASIVTGALASALGDMVRAQVAEPWVLYGHDSQASTNVSLDTKNGLARVLGATGFDSSFTGLEACRAPVTVQGGEVYPAGTMFGLIRDTTFNKDYIVVIENETGKTVKSVELDFSVTGRGIAFGPDGSTLYAYNPPGILYRISTSDGSTVKVGEVVDEEGNRYAGYSLQYDPIGGGFVAFAGSTSSTLIRIDPATASANSKLTSSG